MVRKSSTYTSIFSRGDFCAGAKRALNQSVLRGALFHGGFTTLEHAFELIITVAIAVLGSNGLWAFIQSRSTAKSARDRMILGLGHAEIFRQAEHYIRRGGITTEELEDLNKYLFKPYKEMGGNGTAETIVKKCGELPIISRTEAERRDEANERISYQ